VELIQKLIGDIEPERNDYDEERFENLIKMCDLIYKLTLEARNTYEKYENFQGWSRDTNKANQQ